MNLASTDTSAPVMLTGATGFVAGWIVKGLLEAGVTVHAPVRSPHDPKKVGHLQKMADDSPGEIKFFQADLLESGSYEEAMQGCSIVFHTASPFTSNIKDPQKELVDPALLGTRNVLESANKNDTVKRVVLTSSCAAIFGDSADVAKAPGGILTEAVWNTTSSLRHVPYSYSKLVAEKEAWKIVEAQDRWDLVVINPSLVIGPGTNPNATSESFSIMKQMGDGTLKMGAPRWGLGVVDVRDLAQAQIAAAFQPDAKGRHILSGADTDILEIGACLLEKYGDKYPIPQRALPKWLLWLVGPMINKNMTRKAVTLNINHPWKADNSKSIRELGVNYRPLQESAEDMFQQLIDSGCFAK
jgi:nucleoside-diphosphate-sugar epimerase